MKPHTISRQKPKQKKGPKQQATSQERPEQNLSFNRHTVGNTKRRKTSPNLLQFRAHHMRERASQRLDSFGRLADDGDQEMSRGDARLRVTCFAGGQPIPLGDLQNCCRGSSIWSLSKECSSISGGSSAIFNHLESGEVPSCSSRGSCKQPPIPALYDPSTESSNA